MLLAMVSWSVYSIFIKQHTWKFPTYGALLVMSVIAIILFIPLLPIEWRRSNKLIGLGRS